MNVSLAPAAIEKFLQGRIWIVLTENAPHFNFETPVAFHVSAPSRVASSVFLVERFGLFLVFRISPIGKMSARHARGKAILRKTLARRVLAHRQKLVEFIGSAGDIKPPSPGEIDMVEPMLIGQLDVVSTLYGIALGVRLQGRERHPAVCMKTRYPGFVSGPNLVVFALEGITRIQGQPNRFDGRVIKIVGGNCPAVFFLQPLRRSSIREHKE